MLDIRKVDSRFADGESGAQDRRIFPLRTTLKRIWQGRSGRLFASSVVSASMPSMPSTTSTYSALQLPSTSHQDDDNDRQKPYVNAYDPSPLPKGEREFRRDRGTFVNRTHLSATAGLTCASPATTQQGLLS